MKPSNWFLIIFGYTVLTLLFVYLIPNNSWFSPVRVVFAFVFVAAVPGYCLLTLLFEDGKLDFAEKIILSIALSFSLVGISGLFLGLSPIGINFVSITITLSGVVLVLASLALARKLGFLNLKFRKIPSQSAK